MLHCIALSTERFERFRLYGPLQPISLLRVKRGALHSLAYRRWPAVVFRLGPGRSEMAKRQQATGTLNGQGRVQLARRKQSLALIQIYKKILCSSPLLRHLWKEC